MRRTARLIKEGTDNRFFLLVPPKEFKSALQNIDSYIFGVMDVQWYGVIRRAENFKQIKYTACLFRSCLDRDRGSQYLEELPLFVIEHIRFRLERSHHYLILPFGLLSLMPLNIGGSLLRGQFGVTKSVTIFI